MRGCNRTINFVSVTAKTEEFLFWESTKMSPMQELKVPEMEDVTPVDEGIVLQLTRFAIVFGGILPFIPQYLQIMKTQDASGFSTFVCLVVVSSNVLRIAYWFGHAFDIALLWQSIIMTVVMLILIELCLRVDRKRVESAGNTMRESYFSDWNWSAFWQWTNLSSYIQATSVLLVLSIAYAILLRKHEYFIEPIGFIALLIESTLAFPQFLKNYQNHSTEGMNVAMVALWTIGDALKAFFFFYTLQPIPFRMCACIQLLLDFAVFYQVATYA